jgi:hypothetical protein
MVFDEPLRERMGVSFATNSFGFIRVALRREVILGICRLWETTKGTCRLVEIARSLKDPGFVYALAVNLRRADPHDPTSAMNRAILAAVIAEEMDTRGTYEGSMDRFSSTCGVLCIGAVTATSPNSS